MQEHPFPAHQQRRKGVLLFSQETQTAPRMMFDCLYHKAHTDIAVLFFKHAKVVLFDDIAENAAAEQKYEINPAGQRQIAIGVYNAPTLQPFAKRVPTPISKPPMM